ncbi:unnamed protein product [Urochloa decumbens]|uniref:Sulfotransferase n=1 Tax=Urochloa decumbens TaxID=240449 RepID=A0ABC9H2T0_9POAL
MATPAGTRAPNEASVPVAPPPPLAMPHSNMIEILPSLPLETRSLPLDLRCYNGFWVPERILRAIPDIHAGFETRPSDIFLASSPKSGTTWLKALAFTTLNRATYSPFDAGHPLRRCNPHDCAKFIEVHFDGVKDELEPIPSPRVLSTHLPYSMLPERITGEDSGCRILYICRNPKDVLVSGWLHFKKVSPKSVMGVQSFTLQEAFELFCQGRSLNGPQWQHVLHYWEESLRRPNKVLFLKYEEILCEPVVNLKKLAKFMGCAFEEEEEKGGDMEVNKSGHNYLTKNDGFFRKGVIGDWRNHLTPDMAEKLDKIVEEALQGSGLSFANDL